jgi:hypothetical protein
MDNVEGFLRAAFDGDLLRVQKMLADGDVLITDADVVGDTALFYAAKRIPRSLPTLKWLLEEGGARITERNHEGYTALLKTALNGIYPACQWLLEHGGADIAEADHVGNVVWNMLARRFLTRWHLCDREVAEITAMLRVIVLKGDPPADFGLQLSQPEHTRVVEEGARLRAALPAYLTRQRALLDDHCPLIAPLLALVRDYDSEPTTTEELWATGLGTAPRHFYNMEKRF